MVAKAQTVESASVVARPSVSLVGRDRDLASLVKRIEVFAEMVGYVYNDVFAAQLH